MDEGTGNGEAPSANEAALVLQTVAEFSRRSLASLLPPPEKSILLDVAFRAAREAAELGILSTEEPTGLGLWDFPERPDSFHLSKRILSLLAETSAAVSWHFHSLALGRWACREAGLAGEEAAIAAVEGRCGFARGALFRWLSGQALSEGDRALLQENFLSPGQGGAPAVVQAGTGWGRALFPALSRDGLRLEWHLYRREKLSAEPVGDSHGLEGTASWLLSIPARSEPEERAHLSGGEAARLLLHALAIQAAGLLAVGVGSTRAALRSARRYSTERRQGGSLIGELPAVQQLLGEAAANLEAVETLLESLSVIPKDVRELRRFFAIRAVAHPLLCQAATSALQVFGGYGYMRDYGMEKILRDNQHLKLLGGTPAEIRLCLGAVGEESHVA
ncbi:MAG: acyl-CoA dehydrogenase family protein [Bdellovibrionota bacterium]